MYWNLTLFLGGGSGPVDYYLFKSCVGEYDLCIYFFLCIYLLIYFFFALLYLCPTLILCLNLFTLLYFYMIHIDIITYHYILLVI